MQTIITTKEGLPAVIAAIYKAVDEWEAEQKSKQKPKP